MLANVISEAIEELKESLGSRVLENALAKIVVPKRITREHISKYVRKAFRTGAWKFLAKEARALLLVSSRTVNTVKSYVLYSILKEIFIKIELTSLRGKALYYGLLLLSKRLGSVAKALKQGYLALLFTGISYLNNPPMFRPF